MQLWFLLIFLAVGSVTVGSVADAQSFTWRDVVQRVDMRTDGTVLVYDERTLSTDEDFGDAFICLVLGPTQSVTLLEGGALSPGPPASALQQPCEDGSGGTELVVRQEARVDERRVFFRYRLEGMLTAYSDVVEWYWQILEPTHPPVEGYELNVTLPGPLNGPYDAYVHRLGSSETPTVTLSDTRRQLEVHFARVPQDTGVEVRFLMPPQAFTLTGEGAALERLLRDEIRLAGLDAARRNPWWGALALVPLIGLSTGVWRAARRYRSGAPTMRYPFEPPSDRPPAAVPYLTARFGAAPGAAFHATVMDLARRGYGTFESERGKFNMQLYPKDEGELLPFERAVLAYLQRAATSGGRSDDPNHLAFAELKRYSERHLSGFLSSWSGEVRRWLEGQLGGLRLEPASRRAAGVWFALAVLGAAGCVLGSVLTLGAAQGVFLAGALLCAACGAAALTAIPAWRRVVAPEALGWQGFKRTLSDYTRMKDAPDDFFKLWEVYYCYAAALGVAERFLKNMARAAPERGERVGVAAPLWLGQHASMTDLQSVSATTRTLSSLSQALSSASASASSGGSVAGGGGGGSSGSSSGGR